MPALTEPVTALLIRSARRWWRQLTSMRTALILLFLLAVAAVPGSVLPQRNLGQAQVDDYRRANPGLALWLDRLALFDVFASPWFAAVYLLLMTSLVGCLLPRLRDHASALRRPPPPAPRVLSRLPAHVMLGSSRLSGADAGRCLATMLRRRRFRVVVRDGDGQTPTVAAEKGYLRETGNLLFHFSLLALLVGVAIGNGWGWYGNRLIVAGSDTGFCTSTQQFDEYGLGARITESGLPGYCLELRKFTAEFLDNGQPTQFRADVRWSTAGAAAQSFVMQVNEPLRLDGATVYLLGHGYAPELRYTDSAGRAQTSVVPFLPADSMVTSNGVAMFPDANADRDTGKRSADAQVAFAGSYLPTFGAAGVSAHPDERDPAVVLSAYRGDLGLDNGRPQSVYALPSRPLSDGRLRQLDGGPRTLRPGESWTLDDGSTLQFLGTRRWITVTVRNDPGELIVLVGGTALLAGLILSLSVRRRRLWFRLTPTPQGCTIEAAGLPRIDYTAFEREFASITSQARRDTQAVTELATGAAVRTDRKAEAQ